ncbi:MAG: hypothetical protein JO323_02220 [Acidobacteriia bacterium]|nr:hypothetical protein [Terriglobia bacterium]
MGKLINKGNKERIKAAAAASLGAGVGGAGGATAGVLELAAQGAATELSAGLVIGLGTIAGGLVSFCGYKVYRYLRSKKPAGSASKVSA